MSFSEKHDYATLKFVYDINSVIALGGSPGVVVMGGDLCCKGCEFESQHHILDGHFFKYICCKNCNVCLKRRK